ncbi:MAG: bifunctional [glutamate--ammonia ligase]-adenylyl-L-tyrosine phosphorylase/[glutamate--ammonia-ligase] adenylyltransferase [Pseudomonadota bacterium]
MNTVIPSPDTDFDAAVQRAMHGSRYLQRLLDNDDTLLPWLRTRYLQPCSAQEMAEWLAAMPCGDEEALSRALRHLRKRVMLKLLTRDLGGLANLDEVMTTMTALAELVLQRSLELVMLTMVGQYGSPLGSSSGEAQQLLVIGMGKLGGGELNVSSDIDLIFVYPEDGETAGPRVLSNNEFFSKLGRRLISLINELTGEGYVFRVDMRLRPYGDSGPLTLSMAALEEYLVEQGREWERYAWIKARVVAPSGYSAAAELMQMAQPFVFRKYLDFGAFSSMRKLHVQIRQEVLRRDRLNNIKLGPGGIREIEFIAQVYQLIRGGRDASLRIRPTLQVLQLLCKHGQLSAETTAELSAAYVFLRNLEHRLQYLDDQQTQDLPENPQDQAIIAIGMGYPDYDSMLAQLDHHRALVSIQFTQIFSTEQSDAVGSDTTGLTLWHENMNAAELCAALSRMGYEDELELAERLLHIRTSARYRQLPEVSRQRMDKLIPQFIALCAAPRTREERRKAPRAAPENRDGEQQQPVQPNAPLPQGNRNQTLTRLLNLLESISQRASYLAFLAEYPQVLQRLVGVAAASVWGFEYLIQHPILLDEFLDAREIYRMPDWAALDLELQEQLATCDADMEREMEVLRQFQHTRTFHLLAMDLQGLLSLEVLSDHLSDLANLILRHVLQICWRDARKKHRPQPAFAIIAYGKLGGRELGYASDLDLIFLYDDDHPDAAEIYAKLAQRINTMLGSFTPSGRLYETDLRLRPNGASGLLVSSVAAFTEYQRQHAWVWEHQALTRARYSAGDAQVGKQFEAVRIEVLRQPRDMATLRNEIVAMRQKMHDGHPNTSGLFDIKHDTGGMVDIEFIVQFLVLAHTHQHAELTANSGNLALLQRAAALQLIPALLADQVSQCYRHLRMLQHRMRLNNVTPSRVDAAEVNTQAVIELWKLLLGEA